MKVKVGGRELITMAQLLIPMGEEAELEFPISDRHLKVRVKFVEEEGAEPAYSITGEGEAAVLTLRNFNNPLPAASPSPVIFATWKETKVSLLWTGLSVSGFKHLTLAFYLEP